MFSQILQVLILLCWFFKIYILIYTNFIYYLKVYFLIYVSVDFLTYMVLAIAVCWDLIYNPANSWLL